MSTRKPFFLALVVSMLVSGVLWAQSPATFVINITTPTSTQMIAGNASPLTITGMLGFFAVASLSTGNSATLVYGSVNGETPGCTTNRVTLTGAVRGPEANIAGAGVYYPQAINIVGAGSIQIPSSSPVCIVSTGSTPITGIGYYNR
jgi:hypothetical protein